MAHVDERQRKPLIVEAATLIERLIELASEATQPVLAFDGDGTLWSGDVGEDVFHAAIEQRLLREAALPALRREAERWDMSADGDANDVAARLFRGYLEQRYPERDACAMMTWCYAGMSRAELVDIARRAFAARGLAERLHRELEPIFVFARERRIRTVVVSASPEPIVETAAALWAIGSADVIASRAREEASVIFAELARDVPYAEGKPLALRRELPSGELLAAFGDNAFDVELFQAARVAVAVRPKPALRRRFAEVASLCVLSESVKAG